MIKEKRFKGIGVSEGYGIGKAVVIQELKLDYSGKSFTDAETESARLDAAVEKFTAETKALISELSANAGIPKPRVCVIPEDAPNAFATGRDPEHGVVAVTDGIMRILSPEELRGVIAHEIGHIANRDILIQTIAGVLASVIVSIANFMQFAAIFGGSSNDEEGGTNPIAAFLLAILAPIAASIIQMAISRSREYLADETGARICGQPLALAGALHKLGVASGQIPMQNGNPSTEQMFIVSPLFGFGGGSMANLFSTHPPLEERIARLQEMSRQAR